MPAVDVSEPSAPELMSRSTKSRRRRRVILRRAQLAAPLGHQRAHTRELTIASARSPGDPWTPPSVFARTPPSTKPTKPPIKFLRSSFSRVVAACLAMGRETRSASAASIYTFIAQPDLAQSADLLAGGPRSPVRHRRIVAPMMRAGLSGVPARAPTAVRPPRPSSRSPNEPSSHGTRVPLLHFHEPEALPKTVTGRGPLPYATQFGHPLRTSGYLQ